jgi:hypothetical protein
LTPQIQAIVFKGILHKLIDSAYDLDAMAMQRGVGEWDFDGVRITDAVSAAGAGRLAELSRVDVDLYYVAQEVFLAMMGSHCHPAATQSRLQPNSTAHDACAASEDNPIDQART